MVFENIFNFLCCGTIEVNAEEVNRNAMNDPKNKKIEYDGDGGMEHENKMCEMVVYGDKDKSELLSKTTVVKSLVEPKGMTEEVKEDAVKLNEPTVKLIEASKELIENDVKSLETPPELNGSGADLHKITVKSDEHKNISNNISSRFTFYDNEEFDDKEMLLKEVIEDIESMLNRETKLLKNVGIKEGITELVSNDKKAEEIVCHEDRDYKIFLPKTSTGKPTLVLDLDNTLVYPTANKPGCAAHCIEIGENGARQTIWVVERPYLKEFLSRMSELYEIVLFTAGIREYAQAVAEKIDPLGRISFILDRDHCSVLHKGENSDMLYFKDLKYLGRDLKRTIIVDDREYSYIMNYVNGQHIPPFTGSDDDRYLIDLLEYLVECAKLDDLTTRDILAYK